MKLNPIKEYSRYNEGLHRCAPRQRRIEREELPEFFGALVSQLVQGRLFICQPALRKDIAAALVKSRQGCA